MSIRHTTLAALAAALLIAPSASADWRRAPDYSMRVTCQPHVLTLSESITDLATRRDGSVAGRVRYRIDGATVTAGLKPGRCGRPARLHIWTDR